MRMRQTLEAERCTRALAFEGEGLWRMRPSPRTTRRLAFGRSSVDGGRWAEWALCACGCSELRLANALRGKQLRAPGIRDVSNATAAAEKRGRAGSSRTVQRVHPPRPSANAGRGSALVQKATAAGLAGRAEYARPDSRSATRRRRNELHPELQSGAFLLRRSLVECFLDGGRGRSWHGLARRCSRGSCPPSPGAGR